MSDMVPSAVERDSTVLEGRRVCVIYDCLFPLTYGGAERWYRVLTDRLVQAGATVTYATRQQWEHQPPIWSGVSIVAVSGASELYDPEGVRRLTPAVRFGVGTFNWLRRHRHEYDAVIVANFPFFSLLAAWVALVGTRIPIFVDFHEVWSPAYWRAYAGRLAGTVGAGIQHACIRVTHFAQVFDQENALRLRKRRFKGDVATLAGLLPGGRLAPVATTTPPDNPVVLFVGRHVKHKGVTLLPEILHEARVRLPNLRMTVVSDGPERQRVESAMFQYGLSDAVVFTGSVSDEELSHYFATASCTVVPSFREGYGIVVAESVAAGTPVVVAKNPENLSTSLVIQGVNGFVVDPSPRAMAEGIVTAIEAGSPLRRSAAEWSTQHSHLNSIHRSADQMVTRLATHARASNLRDGSK